MNIETLKNKDGSFRKAKVIDIERCLNAGHVTHLQTERGTIAFRPGKDIDRDDAFLVTRQVPGSHGQDKWFKASERPRIIRAALNFLNGTINANRAGDYFPVEANQAVRDGYVLAVSGDEVLVEYIFPGNVSGRETTALRVVTVMGDRQISYRNHSYKNVPIRWLRACREQGTTGWAGLGQRAHSKIPFPA